MPYWMTVEDPDYFFDGDIELQEQQEDDAVDENRQPDTASS